VVLVGNKADLAAEIKVDRDTIDEVLSTYPSIKYFECSAKNNTNVSDCFEALAASIVKSWEQNNWDK
jgi:GTPase SAR1 family protein